MAFKRLKKKMVTIIPYKYWGMESGFKEIDVAVIKGEESPDPGKRMRWGRDCVGNVISDFKKRGWTRAGKPITVEFETEAMTSHEEKEDELKAVDEYWQKKRCRR